VSEPVHVEVLDEAKPDLRELADREVVREALRLALALREQPYLGDRLREKGNLTPLAAADCRKIKFDRPDRRASATPRHRYRIVYRIEPHEGSPALIVVMAIGIKPAVYRAATARAARRLRAQAQRRHPP
jgi:hypothetical protein